MSRDILAGITEGELRSHLESHTSLECQDCRIHAKAIAQERVVARADLRAVAR